MMVNASQRLGIWWAAVTAAVGAETVLLMDMLLVGLGGWGWGATVRRPKISAVARALFGLGGWGKGRLVAEGG